MAKTKNPLLSLGAKGSLGDTLTFQDRKTQSIVRRKPTPSQPKTLPQMYQRWDYQHYIAEWKSLSAAEKQTWQSAAVPYHMSGFAFFMSYYLSLLPDLAGRWHLDEATGASTFDSSRNSNTGVIVGAAANTGYIGDCRFFDGVNDRIVIPASASINVENYITIAVRLMAYSLGGNNFGRLIAREGTTWFCQIPNALRLYFNIRDSVGVQHSIPTNVNSLILNQWQTFIAIYDGAEQATYMDLVKQATTLAWAQTLQTSADALVIGNRAAFNRAWHGLIDETVIAGEAWNEEQRRLFHERRYPL